MDDHQQLKDSILTVLRHHFQHHIFKFGKLEYNDKTYVPRNRLWIDGVSSAIWYDFELVEDMKYCATHDIGEPYLGLFNRHTETFDVEEEMLALFIQAVNVEKMGDF